MNDTKDVGFVVCVSCGDPMYVNEVEIHNELWPVADYCDNKKCPRYKILIAF